MIDEDGRPRIYPCCDHCTFDCPGYGWHSHRCRICAPWLAQQDDEMDPERLDDPQ